MNTIYSNQVKEVLKEKHIIQLEKWTSMKCNGIIFDSEKDDWSIKTSTFQRKLVNKNHFVLLIETDDGEIFGFYRNSIHYSDVFAFNLESNGRLPKPIKFEINSPKNYQMSINNNSEEKLFYHLSIAMFKKEYKNKSYCYLDCSYYIQSNPNLNQMYGKESKSKRDEFNEKIVEFNPIRFFVIQLE